MFLDQKRAWHLGKNKWTTFDKLFFFISRKIKRRESVYCVKSLKLKSSGVSWYSAALLETVQRVAVKSCKYSLSGAWEESPTAIYIHWELRPIKTRFYHGALKMRF